MFNWKPILRTVVQAVAGAFVAVAGVVLAALAGTASGRISEVDWGLVADVGASASLTALLTSLVAALMNLSKQE